MALSAERQLARLFNSSSFDIGRCAHLCIDVQEQFCNNDNRKATARHIVQDIAPAFAKAGIPTYWVWFGSHDPNEKPDFYLARPQAHEIIRKGGMSAFGSSNIDAVLKAQNIDTLFVSGFYLLQCVAGTVYDARRMRYTATILKDGTDYNNQYDDDRFIIRGVKFADSADLFPLLSQLTASGNCNGGSPASVPAPGS